ncbi:MAG: DUF5615 family PIN-like protein [Dehalococcoidales bacterium]|nr:DUF5615 family PIN-like protein [Dehalococcoidales bacterium]
MVLAPFKPPRYLLDNDLTPDIATALRLFEFDIYHIKDKEIPELSGDSKEPEIFDWCKRNGRTWITHDIAAQKRHAPDLKASRISVLWVRGHPEENSNWVFFKIIVSQIDKFHDKLQNAHGAIHYRATRGPKGLVYDWAESEYDRPKGVTHS